MFAALWGSAPDTEAVSTSQGWYDRASPRAESESVDRESEEKSTKKRKKKRNGATADTTTGEKKKKKLETSEELDEPAKRKKKRKPKTEEDMLTEDNLIPVGSPKTKKKKEKSEQKLSHDTAKPKILNKRKKKSANEKLLPVKGEVQADASSSPKQKKKKTKSQESQASLADGDYLTQTSKTKPDKLEESAKPLVERTNKKRLTWAISPTQPSIFVSEPSEENMLDTKWSASGITSPERQQESFLVQNDDGGAAAAAAAAASAQSEQFRTSPNSEKLSVTLEESRQSPRENVAGELERLNKDAHAPQEELRKPLNDGRLAMLTKKKKKKQHSTLVTAFEDNASEEEMPPPEEKQKRYRPPAPSLSRRLIGNVPPPPFGIAIPPPPPGWLDQTFKKLPSSQKPTSVSSPSSAAERSDKTTSAEEIQSPSTSHSPQRLSPESPTSCGTLSSLRKDTSFPAQAATIIHTSTDSNKDTLKPISKTSPESLKISPRISSLQVKSSTDKNITPSSIERRKPPVLEVIQPSEDHVNADVILQPKPTSDESTKFVGSTTNESIAEDKKVNNRLANQVERTPPKRRPVAALPSPEKNSLSSRNEMVEVETIFGPRVVPTDNRRIVGPRFVFFEPALTDVHQCMKYELACIFIFHVKKIANINFGHVYRLLSAYNDVRILEVRKTPVLAGVGEVIRLVNCLKFAPSQLEYLRRVLPLAEEQFFDYLSTVDGSELKIYAVKEGTVVFPQVPVLRMEGPLGVAQLLETAVLNLMNFPTLIATNAARHRLAAGWDKILLEFGARRAQGPDGAMTASRYSYLASCDDPDNRTGSVPAP